ncbi:MAG: YggS family pyridoxal phosphate-dependent enzyme [Aureispira sp.]
MIQVQQYQHILQQTTKHKAQLIAVSKTKPKEAIQELYDLGQRAFGENKVQELVDKQEALPKDIQWHLIGSLQRNKVKYIAPFVHLIHSIDSLKLLQEINKRAANEGRVIDGLLQFHIAQESTKFGLTIEEACALLDSEAYQAMEHVRVVGVMGMASFTDDTNQVQQEFEQLYQHFEHLKNTYFSNQASFKELSMGMSGDYEWALEAGSTMVRVGSLLFGTR